MSDGSVYHGKPLTMAWQSADGVLSPKIIVPQPASVSRIRTSSLSSSKPQTSSSSITTDDTPPPQQRTHTTSFSKLLEVCLVPQSQIKCANISLSASYWPYRRRISLTSLQFDVLYSTFIYNCKHHALFAKSVTN